MGSLRLPSLDGDLAVSAAAGLATYAVARLWWPAQQKSVKGWSCLVTGAGGSLGSSFALDLAKRGAAVLVLWDVQAKPLREAAERVRKEFPSVRVVEQVVNLAAGPVAIREACLKAWNESGNGLDLVVNNAGISTGKFLCDTSDEIDRLTFDVNALAVVWTVKALLPMMEKRGKGHICNVASMAAFFATAGMVVYAATKFAVRGFSEGLAHELRNRNSPIKVTCVCPSQFESKLFKGFSKFGNLSVSAEYVAKCAVDGVEAELELVIVPKYLAASPLTFGLWQINGYLNFPFDSENPMRQWGGQSHAEGIFRDMGSSAKL